MTLVAVCDVWPATLRVALACGRKSLANTTNSSRNEQFACHTASLYRVIPRGETHIPLTVQTSHARNVSQQHFLRVETMHLFLSRSLIYTSTRERKLVRRALSECSSQRPRLRPEMFRCMRFHFMVGPPVLHNMTSERQHTAFMVAHDSP